jgi:hypothetical protein
MTIQRFAAALALGATALAAGAHSGGMAHGPMHDAAFRADMRLVHEMLQGHEKIERSVENLPDGIRTVTESDDPQVAQSIQAHVGSMDKRLAENRVFNLFSPTLPIIFANKDKITTRVETTTQGSIVVQTSGDPTVVAALQAHAAEVSELVRDGMAAMRRAMMRRHAAARVFDLGQSVPLPAR